MKSDNLRPMNGVQVITDTKTGELTEIRVNAIENPDIAQEIFHLLRAMARVQETQQSRNFKEVSRPEGKMKPMSISDLKKRIKASKESGEVSEAQFFKRYPTWQKSEKLS